MSTKLTFVCSDGLSPACVNPSGPTKRQFASMSSTVGLHSVARNSLGFLFQNTIEGRIAYFPVVGRLDCGSNHAEHRGHWEMDGYGILAIYKSDWVKFGGK